MHAMDNTFHLVAVSCPAWFANDNPELLGSKPLLSNLFFNVFSFFLFSFSGDLVHMEKQTSEDFVQKYVENSLNPEKLLKDIRVILSA